jgi:hypothetical protein
MVEKWNTFLAETLLVTWSGRLSVWGTVTDKVTDGRILLVSFVRFNICKRKALNMWKKEKEKKKPRQPSLTVGIQINWLMLIGFL